MIGKKFMVIAGEASGDRLAADLVQALKAAPFLAAAPEPPEFFGAGGPQMAAAGVQLAVDLTQHAVFGITDALSHYGTFRKIFNDLIQMAAAREPDVLILVDFSGFNLRFARAIRKRTCRNAGTFKNWSPKIVYYVSPQVWASRSYRAAVLAKNVDLLLSIFPFEKEWYARRAPKLRVEFVGHPMMDRHGQATATKPIGAPPLLLLLPGSRRKVIETHLPLMVSAARLILAQQPFRVRLVVPKSMLVTVALQPIEPMPELEIQAGTLEESLREASAAIACSGTVTLECAFFRIPAVVIYKTSFLTYAIGKRIIQVRHIAMPNILAGESIYPELIQNEATPEKIGSSLLSLISERGLSRSLSEKLAAVTAQLGPPGASRRAADAILRVALGKSL